MCRIDLKPIICDTVLVQSRIDETRTVELRRGIQYHFRKAVCLLSHWKFFHWLSFIYSAHPPILFFWQEWSHKKPGVTPWRARAKHPPISWIPAAGRCSYAEWWHNDPITLVLQYLHPDFSQVRLMKDTGSHGEHKKRAVAMCSAGSSASTILQCLTGFQCISLSGGTLAYHRILHRWICLSWGTSIPSGNSITDSPTNTQTLQFLPKFKSNNPDIYTISK